MWKNFHHTIDEHWGENIDAAMANVWIIYNNVLKMHAFQLGTIREDSDMYFKWVHSHSVNLVRYLMTMQKLLHMHWHYKCSMS